MTRPGRDLWWVAVWFMTACSGAPSPGVDVPVAEQPVPDAAPRVAADMTPDAGPAELPAPADAASPPDMIRPPEWHCFQMRRMPHDADYVSICSADALGCGVTREGSIKDGYHTTRCISHPHVACYQVWNRLRDFHFTKCSESLDKCKQRAKDERLYRGEEVVLPCELRG